jgi:hypothetical protein
MALATSLTFLTPLGALLALGVLVPLTALLAVRRRADRVRRAVGLSRLHRPQLSVPLGALVAAAGLLGLSAAQPIFEQTSIRRVRTDAEAFVVIDVSRSMLARAGEASATRIERAKRAASELRESLSNVPVGLASFTDRALPHLFPSADVDVFEATLDRSIGIERPPPSTSFLTNATKLDSLAAIRGLRYFSPAAKKRLVVVLTDGESLPVAGARLGSIFRRPPAIETVFVHFWGEDERVFTRGAPEPEYLPDPSSRALLDGVAESVDGKVFSERSVAVAAQTAEQLVGEGPTVAEGHVRGRKALAPYLAIAAFLPLGLLLWSRDR